jgi:tRNA(Ile)-lysidine synthase
VSERLSLEEAARRARYTFLHETARDRGADRIAVGHTRDDQAETFLMKLIRGAGLKGLGGIFPQRGIVIRPLLDVSRADLRSHLVDCGQSWMEDESNEWLGTPRNRIRHRVLPELDMAYSGAARAIARAAAGSREDGEWLDDLARRRSTELAQVRDDGIEIDAAVLRAEPPPIRRRLIRNVMQSVSGAREIGMEHVQLALDVLDGVCAGAEVPGCRVELRRGKLVLIERSAGPE